mgnify:CR=1 FL=1
MDRGRHSDAVVGPMRVVERADRAYHDVAQLHLHEFEPAADGGDGRDE